MTRDPAKFRELCMLNHRFKEAADHALSAMVLVGQGHQFIGYEEMMREAFEKAAVELGFDLVKREAVKVEVAQ